MVDWSIEESVTAYECNWFSAGYDILTQPSGKRSRYYWVDRPTNGLGIVAIRGNSIAMVQQHRPKLNETFLECPGGDLNPDETYIEGASRELREETGLRAGCFDLLTTYYPSATMRYERGIVIATELETGKVDHDDDEYINWRFVSASEALENARTPPTTGWTLTALLAAKEAGYL